MDGLPPPASMPTQVAPAPGPYQVAPPLYQVTPPTPFALTSGLAVLAGLGYQTPVLGVQVDYLAVIGPELTLTPYVSFGYWPSTKNAFGLKTDPVFSPAGGTMLAFGTKNRGYVDVSYGLGAVQAFGDQQDELYGITVGGGYERLGAGGFLLRVGGGATRLFGDLINDKDRIQPTINFALGAKF